MLSYLVNLAKVQKPDYSETILWCALKYALCMDEGVATEAVILTLQPKIGELGDRVLGDMLTAIESYIQENASGDRKLFLAEWSEVRDWLTAEREARTGRWWDDHEG